MKRFLFLVVVAITALAITGCPNLSGANPSGGGTIVTGALLTENLKMVYQLPGEDSPIARALTDGQSGFVAQLVNAWFFNTGGVLLNMMKQYIGNDYPEIGQAKTYSSKTVSVVGMPFISSAEIGVGTIFVEHIAGVFTLYLKTTASMDAGAHYFPLLIQVEYQGLDRGTGIPTGTLVCYTFGDTKGKCQVQSDGTFSSYYPDAPMVQMTKGVVTLTKSHGGIAFELAGTDFHHAAFGNAHRVGVREENGTATYYIQDATTPAINVSANDKSWIDADLPAHTTWNVIAGAGSVWDSLFGANGTFDSEFQVSIKIP